MIHRHAQQHEHAQSNRLETDMIRNKRLAWSAAAFGAVLLVAGCGSDTQSSASSASTTTTASAVTTTSSSVPAESSATQRHEASSGDPTSSFIPGGPAEGTGQIPGSAGDGGSGLAPGDPTAGSIPGRAGDGGSGLVPGEQPAAGTYCGSGYNELAVWTFGADCGTAMAVQSKYGDQLANSGSKTTSVEEGGLTWLCDEFAGEINPYLQCSSDGGAVRLTS